MAVLPEGEYCGYLRKSRADLEAEGKGDEETYAKHERMLTDLANQLGVKLKKIYRERPISGERISARPEMLDLLSDVEDETWKGVFVVEVERLARGDTMDQGIVAQAFKYSSTLIVTPMRTYDPNNRDDEEYFEFNLFMSRREFKTITRRLQDGRIGSVKEGKFPGNVAPYGYERLKLPGKGFTLKPHPVETPILQLIFSLYTDPDPDQRMGSSRIAEYLNDELKIPSRKNTKWTYSTIIGIIRNPTYVGKVRWKYRAVVKKKDGKSRPRAAAEKVILIDGLHEPLVTEKTFNLAQEIRDSRFLPPAPKGKISNPLASLILCGMCGSSMVARPYTNKNPSTIICVYPGCKNVSSYLHLIEARLLQALRLWLDVYKQHMSNQTDIVTDDSQIRINALQEAQKAILKKLKEYEVQISNLDDLLEQKVYSVEKYVARSQTLEQHINDAKTSLIETEKAIEVEGKRNEARVKTIPQIEHVLSVYPLTDNPAQKNELMKSVIEHVIYTKEKGGRWSGVSDQFSLDLQPRIPR